MRKHFRCNVGAKHLLYEVLVKPSKRAVGRVEDEPAHHTGCAVDLTFEKKTFHNDYFTPTRPGSYQLPIRLAAPNGIRVVSAAPLEGV
jgi:hypothetical protein